MTLSSSSMLLVSHHICRCLFLQPCIWFWEMALRNFIEIQEIKENKNLDFSPKVTLIFYIRKMSISTNKKNVNFNFYNFSCAFSYLTFATVPISSWTKHVTVNTGRASPTDFMMISLPLWETYVFDPPPLRRFWTLSWMKLSNFCFDQKFDYKNSKKAWTRPEQ